VGIVFLIALLIFLLLTFVGYGGLLRALVALVMSVSGIWFAIRILRQVIKHSLWSLRNRLLIVYALIGILPILLILVLVSLSIWALTSELAIHLASSELNRRLDSIRAAAESLEKVQADERRYAAPHIVDSFKERFPGIELHTEDSTGDHSYPDGAATLTLSPGWKDSVGLLQRNGHFYGWAHLHQNGNTFTAIAPLTDDLIADLVPNLGQIVLAETPHGSGDGASKIAGDNPDFEFRDGQLRDKRQSPHSRLAIHNAGRLPPAASRLDVDVNWIAFFPHYDWNDPNHKHSAILMVRTRPSAVLSAIFSAPDQARSVLWAIMIGIAILFLLVEIVALGIGISLSRRITHAVHELYEGTRRVIYGDFRHRIPVRGNDQICELTTSFNQMTENVERLLSVEKEKERLQAELEIAREVQTQLYPKSAPPNRGLQLTVVCEPARVVSGDYYDYEAIRSNKMTFAIGDVAGKGISAALLMATLQAALRAQISLVVGGDEPQNEASLASARLVSELNKQLYAHTAPEKYATFFFAMYEQQTSTLTYTNAGHLPPILIRNGEAVALDINGTVVGAFPFSKYEESKLKLESGDLLVCYTDGVTEPENAYGEMFGEERLIDLVKRFTHEDDQVIIKKIIEAVRDWHPASELPDDLTLLLARRAEAA
jgi:sigma-B regulation protein RsbU (phosphoserine phosphatase)